MILVSGSLMKTSRRDQAALGGERTRKLNRLHGDIPKLQAHKQPRMKTGDPAKSELHSVT